MLRNLGEEGIGDRLPRHARRNRRQPAAVNSSSDSRTGRYEIFKKSIDKAVVEGTSDRVTQPGKIAIIYGQTAEGREYRGYIEGGTPGVQTKARLQHRSGIVDRGAHSLKGVPDQWEILEAVE